ncbi:hypothetical protein [Marinitoga aeolica]|uniref:Septation ring formation regulator EzrA n=1 Tax=Marinitoga aeolica TaxID=2809031 RepID=A0ABY8PRM0_9BACT|nr:hypothetical protein [Marinitoga aeolica]WGS65267.1 hypothetical protein JRV97_01530 [Marinitoga aeolica]
MNDGEFKKENKIEMNISHKELKDKEKIPKNNNKLLIFLLFLNLLLLGGISYLLFEQFTFKVSVKEDIRIIKNKVTEFEGLNNNLEKLNNNFQILDIINSNTRQIPDILIELGENKKILKSFNLNELNKLIEGIKGNNNSNLTNEFKTFEDAIKTELNTTLDKKFNQLLKKISILPNETRQEQSGFKDLNTKIIGIINDVNEIKNNVFSLTQSLNKEIKNSIEIDKKIDNIYSNTSSLKVMVNDMSKEIDKKYISLSNKVMVIDKKISAIKIENYNDKFLELEKRFQNIESDILNFENYFEKSQNKYYKKIEYILNKKDILSQIEKLNNYIESEEFKLIEMVDMYKKIVIEYGEFPNDDEVKKLFLSISEKVHNKLFNVINNEISYVEKSEYNESIKKDINYLTFVVSEFPQVKDYKKEYDSLKQSLEKLKKIEVEKINEYNNMVINEIDSYLALFSKKFISEEEVINAYKEKILKINPELLNERVKERYLKIIEKTKEILGEKYIW